MMVTDLATRDMNERSNAMLDQLLQWLMAPMKLLSSRTKESTTLTIEVPSLAIESQEPLPSPIDFARHRSLTACRRALRLCADHRYDEARCAFHTALVADPRLDLKNVVGFFDMPRRGMFAAIEAYEDVGRYHDAAALEIQILQAPRIDIALATSERRHSLGRG